MKQLILAILLGITTIGICFADGGDKSENIVCEETDTEITTAEIEQVLSSTILKPDIFETSPPKMMYSDKPFNFVPYEDVPEPINPYPPEYPESAKRLGVQGMVVLEVYVYADGTIGQIMVRKSLMAGPGGLDEAAINAVKQWKFEPGKAGGKPIDTTVIIPIEFNIDKRHKADNNKTPKQNDSASVTPADSVKNDRQTYHGKWINPNTKDREFKTTTDYYGYFDVPEPINPVLPEYPPELKKTGIQGTVYLEVEIFSDGIIRKITVKKSLDPEPYGFDDIAINAVRKWKFTPEKQQGKPVDCIIIIPIEFTLTH